MDSTLSLIPDYDITYVQTKELLDLVWPDIVSHYQLGWDTETVGVEGMKYFEEYRALEDSVEKTLIQLNEYKEAMGVKPRSRRPPEVKAKILDYELKIKNLQKKAKKVFKQALDSKSALQHDQAKIALVQISYLDEEGFVHIYLIHARLLDKEDIESIFSDQHRVICHNFTFEYKMVRTTWGFEINPFYVDDTQILMFLTRNDITYKESVSYERAVEVVYGIHIPKDVHLRVTDWTQNLSEQHKQYAANDVLYIHGVRDYLLKDLMHYEEILKPYGISVLDRYRRDVEFAVVLGELEMAGAHVDLDAVETVKKLCIEHAYVEKMEALRLMGFTEEELNINSNAQLLRALKKIGLDIYKTDEKELLKHGSHPVVKHLLEYRKYNKMYTTYAVALEEKNREGRIYGSFNGNSVTTGRLSSSDPNLQNIPVRTDLGKQMRNCFIAPSGKVLLVVDYSQIEIRILAEQSQDIEYIECLKRDEDIHEKTRVALGLTERRDAKIVNFGIVYGQTQFGLAESLHCSTKKAWYLLRCYHMTYRGIEPLFNKRATFASQHGFVVTPGGMIRHVPRINSDVFYEVESARRIAANTPIQGNCAEIMREAMVALWKEFKPLQDRVKCILQVHDELVFECDDDPEFVELTRNKIRDIMVSAAKKYIKTVPVYVGDKEDGYSVKVVKRWGDAK